mmetsp:Transcript_119054/g.330800  ORF Transcript_119054/g.330800 Transcript_119054/m.330800 type:complete len:223 (-) Transcript_119054:268-936(-)
MAAGSNAPRIGNPRKVPSAAEALKLCNRASTVARAGAPKFRAAGGRSWRGGRRGPRRDPQGASAAALADEVQVPEPLRRTSSRRLWWSAEEVACSLSFFNRCRSFSKSSRTVLSVGESLHARTNSYSASATSPSSSKALAFRYVAFGLSGSSHSTSSQNCRAFIDCGGSRRKQHKAKLRRTGIRNAFPLAMSSSSPTFSGVPPVPKMSASGATALKAAMAFS